MSPYEREMRLMPHLMQMERQGVHVNFQALKDDTNKYFNVMARLDAEISQILGTRVDIDSNEALANAIEARGLSKGFASTPTGRRSVSKESLMGAIAHPTLLGHLLCRGAIATCVRTFFQPWLVQAQHHGKLFIRWNQFRNYSDTGARTGRISSSPNLQNIPVTWEQLKMQLESLPYHDHLPEQGGWFEMPSMRKYIVPAPGCIFLGRDYSAQEMRLLAHFSEGGLLETIKANIHEDIHQIAARLAGISRREAKTLGFAILYGAGVGRIAETLGITVGHAAAIKAQYLTRLPEIKRFTKALSELSASGLPITTLAGRQYFVERPNVVQGRLRTFEYKLPNYKIQGSAADQTKRAMYDYAMSRHEGRLVLTVHDQLVIEVPEAYAKSEEQVLATSVNGAFQELLKYTVVSDPGYGYNFSEVKETRTLQ